MEWVNELLQELAQLPPWSAGLLLIVATFVSEDLTCIAAGLAGAGSILHPVAAIAAAALGIWLGDLGLYGLGLWLGRPALRRAPLRWFVTPEAVHRAEEWFRVRGAALLWLARFVPGTRLPTYVAAGMLRTPWWRFAGLTALAVALWAPLLGGGALWIGRELLPWIEHWNAWALVVLLAAVVAWLLVVRTIVPLCTWRGRRQFVGRWRRLTQWEYWPAWTVYPPVVALCLWKALRHRHPTVFTAVNPGMDASGFVGESKSAILESLRDEEGLVARHARISAQAGLEQRLRICLEFQTAHQLAFPLVLKPDAGQRGSGVAIVHSEEEARTWLATIQVDAIVQEYVPGEEYGVFWYRLPHETSGRIFSITKKVFPKLAGDGERTLEELILDDPRAVCMADYYLKVNAHRSKHVPPAGAHVQLVNIGNHCRGTIFLDGSHLCTAELEASLTRVSSRFEGFCYGRYDLRVGSAEELQRGVGFKVIELNGATSEATHMYDPRHRITYAWQTLWKQWQLLFRIAEANRAQGATTTPAKVLWKAWRQYSAGASSHPTS